MTTDSSPSVRAGHPIRFVEVNAENTHEHGQLIEQIISTDRTGVVVKNVLSQGVLDTATDRMTSSQLAHRWGSPNAGMVGGEIRTIGDAATPTFTSFGGPTLHGYAQSLDAHTLRTQEIFDGQSPTQSLQRVFSSLFGDKPASPPQLDDTRPWASYNFRALDPGVQIYSHHDNHYGLDIYQHLDACYDRSVLLSWFVVLQGAESGGELVVYGLWGSDPNPPMLPTRFIDTEALERDYQKHCVHLQAGDLVIFDSGRHVHRVTPVCGQRPRLTLGGFLTVARDRSRLAFWS